MGFTQWEKRFIDEYCVCWNASAAIVDAGYVGQYARQTAYRLLHRPDIRAEVDRRVKEIADKAELKAIDVARNITQVINGDHRDLVEIHHGACRYCYGTYHLYQFTPQEFRNAYQQHIDSDDYKKRAVAFDARGGEGYNPKRDPHPDCPECFGDGIVRTVVHDTRTLSPEAAVLYAGAKTTNGGIEILTRDVSKAIDQAARYLGMNKDTLQIASAPSGLDHFYGNTSEPDAAE